MAGPVDIVESINGVPVSITHGLDVGTSPNGDIEYHYNFLDYVFGADEQTIFARSYLGDDRADVRSHTRDLDTWPLALRALIYLQLRYRELTVLMANGYEPLPKALAKRVEEGVAQFLAASVIDRGGRPA